jgi:hypothetical protein
MESPNKRMAGRRRKDELAMIDILCNTQQPPTK